MYLLDELTHLVTVGLNRGDGRLVDLFLGGVDALLLEDSDITLRKEPVGKINQFLLGNLRDAVDLAYFLLPVNLVDKGIHKHVGPTLIALNQLVEIAFLVVDDAGQQVVGKVTLLQFIDLSQHQTTHLFQCLPFLRRTHQDKATVVVHQFWRSKGTLHLHRLVQVKVKETGLTITQYTLHQFQCVSLQGISLQGTPSYPYLLSLLTNHRRVLWLSQWCQRVESGLGNIIARFPFGKVFLDDLHRLVRIQVTTHTDGHIVGHIPFLEIVLDIRD